MSLSVRLSTHLKRPNGETFFLQAGFELAPGTITALYGPSGTGKTTLLNALAGLLVATDARIGIGQTLWQDTASFIPPENRKIGYVFQDARLLPHLTAEANLQYAWKRKQNDRRLPLATLIDKLELSPYLTKKPDALSGGQKQKVAIAQALATQPDLLILDEALANLDWNNKFKVISLVKHYCQQHQAIVIFVSHNMDEICHFTNNLLLIENGKQQALGPIQEILPQLSHWQDTHDEDSSLLDCTITEIDTRFHLVKAAFNGGALTLINSHLKLDDKIRVRIPARDVSISLDHPLQSSVLNLLEATVESINPHKEGRCLVGLRCAQERLLSIITNKSLERLKLKKGMGVTAQIKSVALPAYLQ
jgi:molybdate transport system ATP-binding protein